MTLEELKELTPVELEYVCAYIYKLVKDRVTPETKNDENFIHTPKCCPHCGSNAFIKYGFKQRKQKYLCKACGKIFCNTTGTLYHKSQNKYVTWKNFIGCEINGLTLLQSSVQIGKSKTTCFNMRHKLYKAIESLVLDKVLVGQTEIDSTYIKINLKGTKPQNMPRYSHKRGTKGVLQGVSHHKICIVTAIDENDNVLFRIAGLGSESLAKYSLFEKNFDKTVKFISDSKPCIKSFANIINAEIEQIPVIPNKKRYATNNGNTISSVNQLHSELSYLITRKHGVGTRHLQDYLNWLVFLKMIKYTVKAEAKTAFTYIESMKYAHTIPVRQICKQTMPIDLKQAYGEYHFGIFS